jgi:hypothetical protein
MMRYMIEQRPFISAVLWVGMILMIGYACYRISKGR